MGHETPTSPGFPLPKKPLQNNGTMALILAVILAMLQLYREIAPAHAESSDTTDIARRIGAVENRLETISGKLDTAITDVAVLKAAQKK